MECSNKQMLYFPYKILIHYIEEDLFFCLQAIYRHLPLIYFKTSNAHLISKSSCPSNISCLVGKKFILFSTYFFILFLHSLTELILFLIPAHDFLDIFEPLANNHRNYFLNISFWNQLNFAYNLHSL